MEHAAGDRGAAPGGGRSLGTRLILAFGAVIVLSLLLASGVAVASLKGEQERAARDRLAMSVYPVTADIRLLAARGAGPQQISAYIADAAEQRDLRLLLVDRNGVVQQDTAGDLEGQELHVPQRPTRRASHVDYAAWTARPHGEGGLVFFNVFLTDDRAGGAGSPAVGSRGGPALVLAAPETDVSREWLGLLPGFARAGVVAFVAAVVVALLLARSITRPLRAMTEASEAMARGDYDRSVSEGGSSEVRRLASSFNVMARQVSRSHALLRSFVANVSHDLKTPLTSILGFSQAMADGTVASPEEVRETGRIIHEEAQRMHRLVDDLLYLSRMEAGEVPLTVEEVDVAALARAVAARLEHRLDGRTLHVSTPEGGAVVRGDAGKLERAVANLLENAVVHSDPGAAIHLRVSAGPSGVDVAVHNTGSYVPPDELERVFDRFHQVERARSGPDRGHGLGLAIAREIAGLHGGGIRAESDPDAGTTFTVHLPSGGPA